MVHTTVFYQARRAANDEVIADTLRGSRSTNLILSSPKSSANGEDNAGDQLKEDLFYYGGEGEPKTEYLWQHSNSSTTSPPSRR